MSVLDWFKKSRKRTTVVDGATIAFEPGFREFARVNYRDATRSLDFDGEWLGWGKGQKMYLLVLISLDVARPDAEQIASRLQRGLDQLRVPCAIGQWEPKVPISEEECERGLASYVEWMRGMGREVTVDKPARTMREARIPGADSRLAEYIKSNPKDYARRFNEAMFCLRGYRSPSRVLAQSEGVEHSA